MGVGGSSPLNPTRGNRVDVSALFFIPPHRKTSNASIRNYGGSSPLWFYQKIKAGNKCLLVFLFPPPCVRRTRKTKFCIRVTLLESAQRAFARRKPLQPFILPLTPLLRLIRWGSASATRLRAGAALALSRVHSILPEN